MAADLNLAPNELERLATNQSTAAADAQSGADAMSGTGSDCWVTHGVISGSSNGAFSTIEETRKAAGAALANGSVGLAAKLRTAKKAYEGVDGELADNMKWQMLDK